MSWLQRLYETYEYCSGRPEFTDPPQSDNQGAPPALMPISHTSQQAHILVVLDGEGNFERAELFPPKTQLVLPATEASAGRTSGDAPHPLMDKIHYCAKDYAGAKKISPSSILNNWEHGVIHHIASQRRKPYTHMCKREPWCMTLSTLAFLLPMSQAS